jgi:Leucine-rich repeat (LRR) protein
MRSGAGGSSIKGTISSELGVLTSLSSLDLDTNLFSGTIPTQLALLTPLYYL